MTDRTKEEAARRLERHGSLPHTKDGWTEDYSGESNRRQVLVDTRDIEKLRRVPVFAVRELLRMVLGADHPLAGKTGEELIGLARDSEAVTQAHIDDLYEEFRYGGRATFHIHLLDGNPAKVDVAKVAVWNAALSEAQADDVEGLNVQVRDALELEHGITEFRYGYETLHRYVEPGTEDQKELGELSFGFLWLNPECGYMVVMSKRERVNAIIADAVAAVLGCSAVSARLPKRLADRWFPIERISRASYYDGATGVRRSISGENLYDSIRSEISEHEQRRQRTGSLHREQITESLESKLGIQMDKGKLYLTRTIRASDLRNWMYSRLHPLVVELRNLSPGERILAYDGPVSSMGLSRRGEGLFREIVGAVVAKRDDRDETCLLSLAADSVYASMPGCFLPPRGVFYCDECNDVATIHCPECGGEVRYERSRQFQCCNCGHVMSRDSTAVVCAEGHPGALGRVGHHLVLYPTQSMLKEVRRTMAEHLDAPFNVDEECFWIDGAELRYSCSDRPAVLVPEDIAAYRALPKQHQIPEELWQGARQLVLDLAEKCHIDNAEHRGQPRRPDCEECYLTNPSRLCIPKLFRALSASFAPVPHGGAEFGDAGLAVTVNGLDMTLVGICKSHEAQPIRLKDGQKGKGYDIVRQVVTQVVADNRVQVFAVVIPGDLDEELRGTIKLLSRATGKPVVFFGLEELTTMCCALLADPDHAALHDLLK